jgi:NADH-ubiquinone oxidoreductase chain 2
MLFINLIFLLLSIAVSSLIQKAIYFSLLTFIMMMFISYLSYTSIELFGIPDRLITYNNLFVVNLNTQMFHLFIYMMVIIILLLTSFYPYNKNGSNNKSIITTFNKKLESIFSYLNIKEYSLIIMFVTIGGILLSISNDIISIFLCIELQSYALYIICGLNRNSESSLNASLMYFLIGAFASSIILLGQSLLYLNTGNTNIESINIINNILDINNNIGINKLLYVSIQHSLSIMIIGFLFKISSAPFHF